MKSKKKLLLMGVGVMGALAMGVGATSTFAWYQASAKVQAASSTAGNIVTVSNPTWTIDASLGDVELDVSITPNTEVTTLPLATWLSTAPTGNNKMRTGETYSAGLWSGWANGSSTESGSTYTKIAKDGTTPLVLFQSYQVTIKVPNRAQTVGGVSYPAADIASMLQSEKVDIALSRQNRYESVGETEYDGEKTYYKKVGGAYVTETVADASDYTSKKANLYLQGAASRAKFFTFSATAVTVAASGAEELNSKTTYATGGISLTDISTATGPSAYFGLYVEGEGSVDTTNVIGDFLVTVSHHS